MNNHKIVCIGDSITYGYEIEDSKKWTSLLSKKLQIEILNFGINGDTTSGMLARFQQHVIDQNPTHAIITGGTNDLWFGLKDEYIISNIYTMSVQARSNNIIPIIGIPTPSLNLIEQNYLFEDYAECIRSFQNSLIKFCLEKELIVIDFSLKMNSSHFLADGLHPNAEGQRIMRANALGILKQVL